jgi:hypothetical protein
MNLKLEYTKKNEVEFINFIFETEGNEDITFKFNVNNSILNYIGFDDFEINENLKKQFIEQKIYLMVSDVNENLIICVKDNNVVFSYSGFHENDIFKINFNTIPNLINVLEVIFNDDVYGELSDNLKRDMSTLLTY